MIKAFKAFFLGRQLREKMLLLAFFAAGVVIWVSSFSGRAHLFWLAGKNAHDTLATQAGWLAKSDSIEARTTTAAAKLDPLKTYNLNSLLGVVDRLAKDSFGNKVAISTEGSKVSGQFSTHSVTASINANNTEADWKLLMYKFYPELEKLSPYVSIEEFTVTAAGVGRPMTVRLRATSVEVIRQ